VNQNTLQKIRRDSKLIRSFFWFIYCSSIGLMRCRMGDFVRFNDDDNIHWVILSMDYCLLVLEMKHVVHQGYLMD